jgi:formate dehydrogenase iron-sulfur subunit
MTACPVDAYDKDPVTGIVKHLDDQCFGCQYCTLACPYDVPSYHAKKGIVRKCDMCSDRLAVGEAPACVQACPHEAITINIVDVDQVRENAEADPFLPAAPEPHLTYPTTHYKTTRVFPRNLLPADYYSVNPQHPHWPLIIMLVLTQLSVGAFAVGMWLETELNANLLAKFQPLHALLALLFGLVALGASTMHLGRPQYAFRAVIGLRHSWLSREIVTFGVFAGTANVYAALVWLGPQSWLGPQWNWLKPIAGWTTVVAGAAGVFCSAMIYVFTRREFWNIGTTLTKFVLTSIVLGSAATWMSILLMGSFVDPDVALQITKTSGNALLQTLLWASVAKLAFEASIFRHLAGYRVSALKRSAKLMVGPLVRSTMARFGFGIIGGVLLPMMLIDQLNSETTTASMESTSVVVMVGIILVACFTGEILERFQFFAAVASPRMPGTIRR